jgi:hypothetical protein
LKSFLDAKGLDPDEMDDDQVDELFETSDAAQKIIDIGRAISEVETRAPDGTRLEFKSIAFIDTLEIPELLRVLAGGADEHHQEAAKGPRYVVSGTLSDEIPAAVNDRLAGQSSARHFADDN